MQVKVLVASTYSRFGGSSIKAEPLSVGDERDWPDWYALSCEDSGLVEIPSLQPPPVAEDMPPEPKAVETIKVIDRSTVETVLAEGPQDGVERYKDVSPVPPADATAGAIKLARGFGIDLSAVTGTGKEGKIVLRDVKDAIASAKEEPESGES